METSDTREYACASTTKNDNDDDEDDEDDEDCERAGASIFAGSASVWVKDSDAEKLKQCSRRRSAWKYDNLCYFALLLLTHTVLYMFLLTQVSPGACGIAERSLSRCHSSAAGN